MRYCHERNSFVKFDRINCLTSDVIQNSTNASKDSFKGREVKK